MENVFVNHSGIKGMRWGIRRFQNKDGSLTPAGKKRYADKDSDRNDSETPEERKERILKNPSAKSVYENRNLFSNKEINDLTLRLDNEQKIKKLIPEQVSRGKQFVDSYSNMSKTIKTVVDSTDSLYKSYETGKLVLDKIFAKK